MSRKTNRVLPYLLLGAFVIAIIARVAFLSTKPFWRDEAWVAALVVSPFGDTFPSFAPVPVGFVALAKITAMLPGLPPEIGFRIFPLLAGLLSLFLLYRLAHALGESEWVAVVALWLGSGSLPFIYYSRELKHYSFDLLFAVATPLLGATVFLKDGGAQRTPPWIYVTLLVILFTAPWLSFGSLFPILATLSLCWIVHWKDSDRCSPFRLTGATLLYIGAFSLSYFWWVRFAVHYPNLRAFWRQQHAFFSYQVYPSLDQIRTAVEQYFSSSFSYLFQGAWPLFVPFVLIGAWCWPRPHRWILWYLCLGTATATIGTALANYYLLAHGRFLLFAAPFYLLFAASGLVHTTSWMAQWRWLSVFRILLLALPFGLSLYWSGSSILHRLTPYHDDWDNYFVYDIIHDIEPVIQQAAQVVRPGDAVLFNRWAGTQFLYYSKGRLSGSTVWTHDLFNMPARMQKWLSGVGKRGWIILLTDEKQPWIQKMIAKNGFAMEEVRSTGTTLLWKIERK